MRTILHLDLRDHQHLEAAEGWLGLGNWQEASEELEKITPQQRAHPESLCTRWKIYSMAKKWEAAYEVARTLSEAVPDGSFALGFMAVALHELKRTDEARTLLLSIVDKFPKNHVIRYNLACYASKLGDFREARKWLERALDLSEGMSLMEAAVDDPDLEQFWANIGNIPSSESQLPD